MSRAPRSQHQLACRLGPLPRCWCHLLCSLVTDPEPEVLAKLLFSFCPTEADMFIMILTELWGNMVHS